MSKTKLVQMGAILTLILLGIAGALSPAITHGATNASVITTPASVQVTATGLQSVTLSWSASTDSSGTGDVPAYYVYNGSNIVATSMGTTVTVSSLLPSSNYTLTVQAYDKDGNTSGQSSAVTATTKAAGGATYQKIAYFDQWGIYGNSYYPSNVVKSGAAAQLTTIIYDFENIDPPILPVLRPSRPRTRPMRATRTRVMEQVTPLPIIRRAIPLILAWMVPLTPGASRLKATSTSCVS